MARISYEKAPPGLKAILDDGEFHHDLHRDLVQHGQRYNIALAQVEYDGNRIRGKLVRNPAMEARFYGQTTRKPEPEEITNTIVQLWLPDASYLRSSSEVWAFAVTAQMEQHNKRRDAIHFETMEDSVIMPHPERSMLTQKVTMELFAGGFGGWSWAKRHAEIVGAPKIRTISVEKDHMTAIQHGVNHSAHIFPSNAITPPDLLHRIEGDCMFIQDVAETGWKKSVTTHRHQYWTISASCQSWSAAGHAAGLQDPRGMTLPQSLASARMFRPKAILVEQVQGFRRHEDYSHFLAMTHWAGYYCWNEDICELSEICPIRRPRYLGIFLRESECWENLPPYLKWGNFDTMYPMEFGAWLTSTPDEFAKFAPTDTEKAFYMHAELFPKKPKEPISEHRIFQARVPGLMRIQPVAMAMYGQQHHLALHLLREKGLHGFFCQEASSYRWYIPLEIALLHLQTDAIILMKREHAWRILGNMIAMPHALLQLTNMWRSLGEFPKEFPMNALFAKLRSMRMQSKHVMVHEDDQAWYMAFPNDMPKLRERMEHFVRILGGGKLQDTEIPCQTFVHAAYGKTSLQVLFEQSSQASPRCISVPNADDSYANFPVEVKMEANENEDAVFGLEEVLRNQNKRLKREASKLNICQKNSQVHPFLIPGEYGAFEIANNVRAQHLQNLWHHPIWLQDLAEPKQVPVVHDLEGLLFACPVSTLPEQASLPKPLPLKDTGVILVRSDTKVTVHAFEPNMKVAQIPGSFREEPVVRYDEYGEVIESMQLRSNTMLMPSQLPIPTCRNLTKVLEAAQRTMIQSFVPEETDILVVTFHGSSQDVQDIINLWNEVFTKHWLDQHGRHMNLQVLEDHCRFLFVPSKVKSATPVPVLIKFLQVRLAKSMLQALHDPAGVPTVLKHECKQMIDLHLSPHATVEPIFQITRHAFVLQEKGTDMTMVAFGRRVGGLATPAILMDSKSVQRLTIQLRHSLWGGGPPGTRQEHHHMLHTELAAMFHQDGHTVQATPDLVERVLREQGHTKVHHMLFRHPNRQEAFAKMCQDLDIPQPNLKKKPYTTKMKFQKLARHDLQAHQQAAKDFVLQPGFFRFENGEEATLLPQFTAWTRGVCLMDSQQAEPWLKQGSQQSPDELAIFVPTPRLLEAARPHRYLHAPALDKEGRQALLGGTLIQLGEKQIHSQEVNKPPKRAQLRFAQSRCGRKTSLRINGEC